MKDTHPIGRFRVSVDLIKDNWKELLPVFSRMVITRAECLYSTNCIEYVALSDLFEPISTMMEAPMYSIECTTNDADQVVVAKAVRI